MGLKKNILYNSLLTASLYIFQFITYPYVARVLGVTNIGICNFSQSIVQYFALFSMLGVSTLGVREIAKCNGDKEKLNKTFSGIFQINLILTLVVIAIFIISIELVPQLSSYRKLLYIGVFQIFFNTLTIEWLFKGLENFKYITIRTFWVRIIYVISVFVFVRDKSDYSLYFFITVGLYVVNGLINCSYGISQVKFSWQPINDIIVRYMKPMLFLGSQLILTTMYTSFNVVYLGFVAGDNEVGYYTTATKIQNIILALYSSFTIVMMPRISSLLAEKNDEMVREMVNKSFTILYAFAFPVIIISEVFAPEIISIISGPGYEASIPLLRFAMPLILIIGLEQILIFQLLLPLRLDRYVLINSIIGASCGIIFNIFFVGYLKSTGSILVWFLSELAVLISANYFVRRRLGAIISLKRLFEYLFLFVPLFIICVCCKYCFQSQFYSMALSVFITLIYCHVSLFYLIKNELYIGLYKRLIAKIKKYQLST